jgi:hypothetical protein
MLWISDCIAGGVRFAVPEPTKWQAIRNPIDAALITTPSEFVNMHFGIGYHFVIAPLKLFYPPMEILSCI